MMSPVFPYVSHMYLYFIGLEVFPIYLPAFHLFTQVNTMFHGPKLDQIGTNGTKCGSFYRSDPEPKCTHPDTPRFILFGSNLVQSETPVSVCLQTRQLMYGLGQIKVPDLSHLLPIGPN